MLKSYRLTIFTCFVLCIASTQSLALDLTGASITLQGSSKVNIKKLDSATNPHSIDITFGPTEDPNVAANAFLFLDNTGDSLIGNFIVNDKNDMELTPDPSSLNNYVQEKIMDAIEDSNKINSQLFTITKIIIYQQSFDFSAKEQKSGISSSTKLQAKCLIEANNNGNIEAMFVDVDLSAKAKFDSDVAGNQVDPNEVGVAGSTWDGSSKTKVTFKPTSLTISLKKSHRVRQSDKNTTIHFGPNQDSNLVDFEFNTEADLDNDNLKEEILYGTFSLGQKEKLALSLDPLLIEEIAIQLIKDNITEIVAPIPLVSQDIEQLQINIAISNVEAEGKIKPGKSVSFTVSFNFAANVEILDQEVFIFTTYSTTVKAKPSLF